MDLSNILIYIGSWGGVVAGTWKFFDEISKVTKPEFNEKVTLWIQNINFDSKNSNSGQVIYGMFTRFFGEKHLSFKCFYRSALYTLIVFLVCTTLVSIVYKTLIFEDSFFGPWYIPVGIIYLYMCIQDYLALFKTRIILKLFLKQKNKNPLLLICLDFLSTILIFSLLLLPYDLLSNMKDENKSLSSFFASYISDWVGILTDPFQNYSFFVDTIFVGTIWIVFIQLAGLFTKLFSKIFGYFDIFKSVIDIEKHPIKSVGAISVLVITAVYIVGLPIFLFVHK